jgi:hypothetical protein
MRKRIFIFMMLCALVITLIPYGQAFAADSSQEASLAAVKGLDSNQREAIYLQLVFKPEFLFVGKIVSDSPYAVVTYYNPNDKDTVVKIRVWTGMLNRSENTLFATWDELRIGQSGEVKLQVKDLEYAVNNYFNAASQGEFQKAEFLGIVPFAADIPVDQEAGTSKQGKVAEDGIYNVYNIQFNVNLLQSAHQETVKLVSEIPQIGAAKISPSDSKNHWAKDYMEYLNNSGIIQGYEDHTIRPQNQLTRAEFIALLTRAVGMKPLQDKSSSFQDTAKHWSNGIIAVAEQEGIVGKTSSEEHFRPNDPITRIEMMEFIAKEIQRYPFIRSDAQLNFSDLEGLTDLQKKSILSNYSSGLISGYPDGTIKPANHLTRAESFKVISSLVVLIK